MVVVQFVRYIRVVGQALWPGDGHVGIEHPAFVGRLIRGRHQCAVARYERRRVVLSAGVLGVYVVPFPGALQVESLGGVHLKQTQQAVGP